MGYCFDITDSSFHIEERHYPDLMDHLIKFHNQLIAQKVEVKWVDLPAALSLLEQGDLIGFFCAWNYEVKIDITTGDIVDITTMAEKIADEEKLWEQIAPWVVDCSYIQCHGEDGAYWRWVWREGAYYYVEATLRFDDPIDCGYRIVNANMMDDELRAARKAVGYDEDQVPLKPDPVTTLNEIINSIHQPIDTQYALNALRTKGTT
jgi:hypothetical protein